MNYRFMRLIVFFDLPTLTNEDKRNYTRFHKYLLKSGFVMMQKSVYSKLAVNNVTSQTLRNKIAQNVPPSGVVELLEITENQFARIEYLVGEHQSEVVDSADKVIEI